MSPFVLALVLSSAVVLLPRGYRVGDLSVVYPLARGTGPLLATAGAVLLLSPVALRVPGDMAGLWRAQRWRVLGIALLSPLSYILILLALRQGDVGHIAPAREISSLIGAWLGGRVLGEGDRRRRLSAAAAFAGGVIALAFA